MKPVMQTTFHEKDCDGNTVSRGNCFSACVASILEFPIEAVPDWPRLSFHKSNWKLDLMTWLNCYGLQITTVSRGIDNPPPVDSDDYYIVSGPSPRFPDTVRHSCIWHKGEIVHDPHYTNLGLLHPDQWQLISKVQFF